jgi:hypothetical protein
VLAIGKMIVGRYTVSGSAPVSNVTVGMQVEKAQKRRKRFREVFGISVISQDAVFWLKDWGYSITWIALSGHWTSHALHTRHS